MRARFRLALALFLAVATTNGAQARGGKPHVPKELYQQMLAARVACDAADEALFGNMQQAGEAFAGFCRKRGFPRSTRELASIENELYTIANTNPYAKDPLLAQEVETHFPQARTQVSIDTDVGLSNAYINQLAQHTPELWHAVPGSLIIVHNDRDLFLIWAAGIDGKPLKDKNEHIRLVYGQLPHRQ
jgi:hypothetical protein